MGAMTSAPSRGGRGRAQAAIASDHPLTLSHVQAQSIFDSMRGSAWRMGGVNGESNYPHGKEINGKNPSATETDRNHHVQWIVMNT